MWSPAVSDSDCEMAEGGSDWLGSEVGFKVGDLSVILATRQEEKHEMIIKLSGCWSKTGCCSVNGIWFS